MAGQPTDPLRERALRRAWRDTRHWSTNTLLSLLWLGACGAAGGVYGPDLLGHVGLHPHLAAVVGALIGIAIGLALAVLARLLMTLQLQRDEARVALNDTLGERDEARKALAEARQERDDARNERDEARASTHVENQFVITPGVSPEQTLKLFRQARTPLPPVEPAEAAEGPETAGEDQEAPK